MTYGISYMGSKNAIAEQIIGILPEGRRFVDLFGGGFAMSHCAILSRKWDRVYYNDYNPLLPPLIKDAIEGKYDYSKFRPEWVSREDFSAQKDKDGYIKYGWSFGGGGQEYIFGADKEEVKRSAHNFVVFGEADVFIKNIDGLETAVTAKNIIRRRMQFSQIMREAKQKASGQTEQFEKSGDFHSLSA